MSMQLKPKESLSHGLRRVYRRHLSRALASLELPDQAKAIHDVRREIKAMRALMKLGRDGLNRRDYKKITSALRLAAKPLSAPRDALVKRKSLEKIPRPPVALDQLRPVLKAHSDREQSRFAENQTGLAAGRRLRKLVKPVAELKVSSFHWKNARLRLKKSYRQGRQAYLQARRDPTPENFHAWRKRVKNLQLQLSFLCRDWPRHTKETLNNLKKLGDCLGDDHDFVLLETFAREQRINRPGLMALSRLIRSRRQEYQRQARLLGARIYKPAPAKACQQLERDWKTWRRKSR